MHLIKISLKVTTIFFISGLLCHLDDACTSNPCHADAICDTSPINGSYTCSCASGYKGIDCSEDIDECEQGTLQIIIGCKYHKNVLPFQLPTACFKDTTLNM